jgi:hypothetical protein
VLTSVASCAFSACARATTNAGADPAAATVAASSAPPSSAAPDAVGVASDAAVATGCSFDARFAAASAVDVDVWRSAHGVKSPLAAERCWDASDRVGVPQAPGLFCLGVIPAKKSLASDVRLRLHRLEGGALPVVWDETVSTYANWLELTPTVSANGATLALHEASPHRCDGAIHESREKDAASVNIDGLTALLVRACGRRGVYAWTGKKYERAPDPAKIAPADLAGDPCPPDAPSDPTLFDLPP